MNKKLVKTRSRVSTQKEKTKLRRPALTWDKILPATAKEKPKSIQNINWKKNFELAKIILSHKLPVKTSLLATAFVLFFALMPFAAELGAETYQHQYNFNSRPIAKNSPNKLNGQVLSANTTTPLSKSLLVK